MFADLPEHVAGVDGRGGGLPAAYAPPLIRVLSQAHENISGQYDYEYPWPE